MICFRGEQSWRLPSYKVKQFYFTAEDPGSARNYSACQATNVAQRNAFRRRDARQQSRSFARWNQSLTRSPQLQLASLRLSAITSQPLMADGFWSFWTPRCSCNAKSRHAVKHDRSFRKYGRAAERVHSLERPTARCRLDGKDFVSIRKDGVQ
jgi:hypothetical protein